MEKLILFDVDGTLLSTQGAASRVFREALIEVYGTAGPIDSYPFHGRTDPEIARALLTHAGVDEEEIDRGFERLWKAYLRGLRSALAKEDHQTRLMPGVVPLLDALELQRDVALLGLLTGNIIEGARVKLASCGLEGRFAFGAYGSDHERRDRLPAIAVERALSHSGVTFAGTDVVIVGDTPFDVACGQPIGARAVAVATGRHSESELDEAGADVVLSSFADLDVSLAAVLED